MRLPYKMPQRARHKAINAMHRFAFANAAALTALLLGEVGVARACARNARQHWLMACVRENVENDHG